MDEAFQRAYDSEMNAWDEVNRDLRHYGLQPISALHPAHLTTQNEIIFMDPMMMRSIRHSLNTLMLDCERRQNLVQDLILNNNKLRDDLKQQNEMAENYEQRAKDLKLMLESSKYKLKELEEDNSLERSLLEEREEKLRNTKHVVQSQNKQLDRKLQLQQDEISRLRNKIKLINEQDENRIKRQRQVFEKLKRRSVRSHNPHDEKLLDIIDNYETQIQHLQKQLDLRDTDSDVDDDDDDITPPPSVKQNDSSSHYKRLFKTYEKELHDSKQVIKDLEDRNELIKMELDSRPLMKDFRTLQARNKKLEKIIAKHKINVTEERIETTGIDRKYSTLAEDIDYLPLGHCRHHLKQICSKFGLMDLADVMPQIGKNLKQVEIQPKLEQFARDVLNIVNSRNALRPPNNDDLQPVSPAKAHAVWCEQTWAHVIPTLQHWLEQLSSLKELKQSVKRLAIHLIPWKPIRFTDDSDMYDVIEAIDDLSNEDFKFDKDSIPETKPPPPPMMEAMIAHFQKLFDVPSLSGVYPRMNEIYSKLGEVHNVMHSIKTLLALDEDCKSSCVVDTVGKLCQLQNAATAEQLEGLLNGDDLDLILQKLEMYDEFFPAFEETVTKLMEILEIQRMEQIIPAVRAVKLLAS
ncbi:centrosomal protein of 70 kDa-like isoform X2 [Tubulanus polymorphus]